MRLPGFHYMIRIRLLSLLACATLMACGQPAPNGDHVSSVDLEGQPGDTPPPAPPPKSDGGANSDNDGYPDLTPAQLTPEAEASETGARNVLISWARAIELREFDQAYAMMSDADRAKWSPAQWRALFADLGEITVAIPSGTMEGAAGSSYYTSQATITANDADGRPIRYEGPVILKRANDVPGSTDSQRRWRIEQVDLDWSH